MAHSNLGSRGQFRSRWTNLLHQGPPRHPMLRRPQRATLSLHRSPTQVPPPAQALHPRRHTDTATLGTHLQQGLLLCSGTT